MPVKRPNLQLKLPPLKTPGSLAEVQTQSTREHLGAHLDSIGLQMRSEPLPHFREDLHAPDYSAMRKSGWGDLHNGFVLNSGGDVFMHARRQRGRCAGVFDGDKFHISVAREAVPQAFDALSGLLFSEDSPIDKWKVTDIERGSSAVRVGEGSQFTLYAKPDMADSQYTARGLNRIRAFVERLDSALTERDIRPGKHPESDVRPAHWQYTSYRNESRSEREGSEAQSRALHSEPFYRLVTE
jgi:phosphothreonine lyase